MTRSSGRRVRSRLGTASVEVLVMLPVFIALFAASYYVHVVGQTAQQVAASARACVWAKALRGCPEDEPPLCAQLDPSQARELDAEHDGGSWFDELSEWPVLGEAVESLFGAGVSATDRREVASLRGERIEVARSAYLVCNPVPQSWEDKLRKLLCHVADGAGLSICR